MNARTVRRRLGTGLCAVAVTVGAGVSLAPAAYAATSVTVSKEGSTMRVRGTIAGESMDITGSGNSATIGNAVAGFGCTQLGGVVQCTGINRIVVTAAGGDDAVRVSGSIPSSLNGGFGSDRLSGADGDDNIFGESGIDFAFGGKGIDNCFSENPTGCETFNP